MAALYLHEPKRQAAVADRAHLPPRLDHGHRAEDVGREPPLVGRPLDDLVGRAAVAAGDATLVRARQVAMATEAFQRALARAAPVGRAVLGPGLPASALDEPSCRGVHERDGARAGGPGLGACHCGAIGAAGLGSLRGGAGVGPGDRNRRRGDDGTDDQRPELSA
jgi:hypothetical protein